MIFISHLTIQRIHPRSRRTARPSSTYSLPIWVQSGYFSSCHHMYLLVSGVGEGARQAHADFFLRLYDKDCQLSTKICGPFLGWLCPCDQKKKKKSLIEYKQKGGFRKILHLQAMYGNDPHSFCPLHWWEFNQMAPPTCKEGWEM